MDYPKYLIEFKAVDGSGNNLVWEKTEKNKWKINTDGKEVIRVSYEVFAFRTSVADSFLDDGRGFISPTGIFMYPAGHKDHPVVVTIIPYEKFSEVSTGLEPVPGKKNTFYASDFDVLYDCPILAGNQEILKFETGGIPYTIAAENLGKIDRSKLIEYYRKIVEVCHFSHRRHPLQALYFPPDEQGHGRAGTYKFNGSLFKSSRFRIIRSI